MIRFILILIGAGVVCVQGTATALDEAAIKKILQRSVIGTETTLSEVQSFAERHIPTVGQAASRDQWEIMARNTREQVLDNVVFQGEAAKWREDKSDIQWLETIQQPDYQIKKLRYEVVPGMWVPALLYEPHKLDGKVPVVLNVNGHDRANGKSADYKQIRCINQAKRGMLALNVEWLGMGQLATPGFTHYAMNQIDLCGTSGLAPFFLSMTRGLDVLLAHQHADPKRVAVAGLSGGGWQTIFISSLDTRVTLANPVAGYSSFLTRVRHFKDMGDSEQTPNDLAMYADYTHLTAMLAPRSALLTYNEADNCCFESPYALPPLLDAAQPIYELYGQPDRLNWHVNRNPGTHNFEQDNRQALYRAIGDTFYKGSAEFSADEFPCEEEVKSKEELFVPIPDDNVSLNSLAGRLSQLLPRDAKLPTHQSEAIKWQDQSRDELNSLIRSQRDNYDCVSERQDAFSREGITITYWRMKIGKNWTVPAVEFAPPGTQRVAIVVSDQGRMSSAAAVHEQLAAGKRVLAVDPFYFGESQISQKDFLFALLLASIGRRPLGIQANQVASIARWCEVTYRDDPVNLVALGPRSSVFSLVAAGIERDAIAAVQLNESLGSLKELIEANQTVRQMPELFCFGLLERFDILHLAALVAPRPLTIHSPNDRVRDELKSLAAWYKTLGSNHKPFSGND